ncbi:enoyl-CoA hydratase [Bradyrhizobium sp. USDA 4516]
MAKTTDFDHKDNDLLRELRDGVLILTLNRPSAYNAWTMALREELTKIFEVAETDESIEAIVFTGSGVNAFCSGQDLAELECIPEGPAATHLLERFFVCYDAIRSFSKPLLAAVNGVAAGSGFQLAQLCDYVVSYPGARMGQTEVNSGLPSIFGTWLMSERIGSRAYGLSLEGRLMDADEAKQLGFINEIVSQEEVLDATVAAARRLAKQPRQAYHLSKVAIRLLDQARYDKACAMALRSYEDAFDEGAPQEEIAQFYERHGSAATTPSNG